MSATMLASEGLAVTAGDEGAVQFRAVIERAIAPTPCVSRAISAQEDTKIRDTGFNRRTNFVVGAIVLIVLGAAALITLRLIL